MSIHLVLVFFMSPFGTAALAAHSLVQRVDTFVQTPSAGLGSSSGILAGQNLGAGQPDRAERSGWLAVGLFTAVAAVISIAIWFWGDYVVRLFSTEPEIVEIAFGFLRIQVAGYLLFGLAVGISMCVEGVGDTVFTMIITLVSMWGIQVPLAHYMPRFIEPGYNGVRWAMVIALAFRAVIYAAYFRMGRWKRRKV
jgi:Na+-driven multidrug efflux pump